MGRRGLQPGLRGAAADRRHAGRPAGPQARVPGRRSGLHPGLDAVRHVRIDQRARRGAHAAGRGRGAADPREPVDHPQHVPGPGRAGPRHRPVGRHIRARARAGPGDRRSAGRRVRLGERVLDQRADRRGGAGGGPARAAGVPRPPRALRRPRPAPGRAGSGRAGVRADRGTELGLGEPPRPGRGGGGARGADGVPRRRITPPGADARAGPVPGAGRRRGPDERVHGDVRDVRRAVLPAAADAGRLRLVAHHGRDRRAAGDRLDHADRAVRRGGRRAVRAASAPWSPV